MRFLLPRQTLTPARWRCRACMCSRRTHSLRSRLLLRSRGSLTSPDTDAQPEFNDANLRQSPPFLLRRHNPHLAACGIVHIWYNKGGVLNAECTVYLKVPRATWPPSLAQQLLWPFCRHSFGGFQITQDYTISNYKFTPMPKARGNAPVAGYRPWQFSVKSQILRCFFLG